MVRRPPTHRIVVACLAAVWISVGCGTASATEPVKDLLVATRAAIAATNLTPFDIGSRYGQALGASETCPGGKLTAKAAVLPSVYADAKLAEFGAQEKKIYDAWMRVKHCVRDDTPGQCKVIIDESCATALSEIGPSGSAVPGLFEISRP